MQDIIANEDNQRINKTNNKGTKIIKCENNKSNGNNDHN